MTAFIVKRVLSLIPILFIMSVIVFLIIYLIPGDPARVMLGDGADEATIQQLRANMGLDQPLILQYGQWMGSALQGDLGDSYFLKKSVSAVIGEHLQPTLSLALLAELIAIAIALPFGIWAAVNRGGWADKALTAYTLLGITIPGFLLSMFLVLLFAVQLKWLPVSGYAPISDGLWNFLKFLILPGVSVGVVMSSVIARIVRSSFLEVMNQGYVKTARSKGLRERSIVYKHILRNALIPILTVIGGTFGTLLAGAAVVESIFNIPGLGQLLVHSVSRRDYTVIQGLVLFIAFTYVLVNLVVDLLYAVVDPRIRLNK
ncbi:peptide/nickel transport system permease protein [Paenibacillus algorifonticola]|uniref:Peptide/nickel transport system permease protein n=1 Tax=Paenibacillus algorifonticola TaxID=684063 RepID=A0A1I2GQA2_9BACL|nr:ABC transporter permease [Paenibacillus algorifonticola]SFF18826.1 peptide/nickel transport system permease protein [Paenibacillus algorifonticola]